MTQVIIENVDEVYVKINANKGIISEISEQFMFYAENYKWNPKFKQGIWDGKIRLLNGGSKQIYKGLVPEIADYLVQADIDFELDPAVVDLDYKIDEADVYKLYEKLEAPYIPHDYQVEAVKHCINNNRSMILSPTASGKSYFLYGLARFYQMMGLRVLVVVHRSALVKQLIEDNFSEEFDLNRGSFSTHQIYDGADKYVEADITASTWQSIFRQPEAWFTGINPQTGNRVKAPNGNVWKGFDVILADEVHAWKATSTISIMSKTTNIKYKHGTSGTLDDIQGNIKTLTGLFGPPHRVAETADLIDRGELAKLKIKAVILNYPTKVRKFLAKMSGKTTPVEQRWGYKDELDLIYESNERYKFLRNLENNLEGNILIAFRHEVHGDMLMKVIKNENKFYIDGTVKVDKRSEYSKQMNNSVGMTGVVSLGTFAEGINIKNVNHVILACPLKSKVKILQLIGRGLRLSEVFDDITFWDICDNMKYGKRNNFALNHFIERMKRYKEEGFDMDVIEYDLDE